MKLALLLPHHPPCSWCHGGIAQFFSPTQAGACVIQVKATSLNHHRHLDVQWSPDRCAPHPGLMWHNPDCKNLGPKSMVPKHTESPDKSPRPMHCIGKMQFSLWWMVVNWEESVKP